MLNGKAWGIQYSDGQCHSFGWVNPVNAPIHDPKYCTKETDVTYSGSPYIKELSKAKLVKVRRETVVIIEE